MSTDRSEPRGAATAAERDELMDLLAVKINEAEQQGYRSFRLPPLSVAEGHRIMRALASPAEPETRTLDALREDALRAVSNWGVLIQANPDTALAAQKVVEYIHARYLAALRATPATPGARKEPEKCRKPGCGALKGRCADWDCPEGDFVRQYAGRAATPGAQTLERYTLWLGDDLGRLEVTVVDGHVAHRWLDREAGAQTEPREGLRLTIRPERAGQLAAQLKAVEHELYVHDDGQSWLSPLRAQLRELASSLTREGKPHEHPESPETR